MYNHLPHTSSFVVAHITNEIGKSDEPINVMKT